MLGSGVHQCEVLLKEGGEEGDCGQMARTRVQPSSCFAAQHQEDQGGGTRAWIPLVSPLPFLFQQGRLGALGPGQKRLTLSWGG